MLWSVVISYDLLCFGFLQLMSFRYSQSSFWKLKFSEAVAQKNEQIPALGKSCSALQVPVSSGASCHHLGDKTVSVRWSVTSCLSNFFCWKPCEGTRRPPSLAGCDAVLLKDDFSPAGQDQAVGAQIIFVCVNAFMCDETLLFLKQFDG